MIQPTTTRLRDVARDVSGIRTRPSLMGVNVDLIYKSTFRCRVCRRGGRGL